jgi:hypothetical protein
MSDRLIHLKVVVEISGLCIHDEKMDSHADMVRYLICVVHPDGSDLAQLHECVAGKTLQAYYRSHSLVLNEEDFSTGIRVEIRDQHKEPLEAGGLQRLDTTVRVVEAEIKVDLMCNSAQEASDE